MMAKPVVYVASRASIPERAGMWRLLRAAGAQIISSWIDEDGEGETACFTELWSRIEAEVKACDRLVLFAAPEDFPLKGALVEVGMALALGKPVIVVAPNVILDPRSRRPLGSWSSHPLVRFSQDIEEAVNG